MVEIIVHIAIVLAVLRNVFFAGDASDSINDYDGSICLARASGGRLNKNLTQQCWPNSINVGSKFNTRC